MKSGYKLAKLVITLIQLCVTNFKFEKHYLIEDGWGITKQT